MIRFVTGMVIVLKIYLLAPAALRECARIRDPYRPLEVTAVFHDGFNQPNPYPVVQYMVKTSGEEVRYFIDIRGDGTVDEIITVYDGKSWSHDYSVSNDPLKNKVSQERAQRLFLEAKELPAPT